MAAISNQSMVLRCVRCLAVADDDAIFEGCRDCRTDDFRANLEVELKGQNYVTPGTRREGIWRWRNSLPRFRDGVEVSLGEGDTPLIALQHGDRTVYVKDESQNPTWSHKDRLCAVAATHAVSVDAPVMVVSSSGNHALSAAAYAARAGRPCVVVTHQGMPQPVRAAVAAYGAQLVIVPGPKRWELVARSVSELGWYPVSNFTAPATGNPVAAEGYKTIAFEIAEQLDWNGPSAVIVPTGYAEMLCGIWSGFKELKAAGVIDRLPKLVSAEPARSAPLYHSLAQDSQDPLPVAGGKSLAASINVKVTSLHALMVIRESGGWGMAITEADLLAGHREAASHGLYVENASATAYAALLRTERDLGDLPVLISTSTGIKDADSRGGADGIELDGEWESFRAAIPQDLV